MSPYEHPLSLALRLAIATTVLAFVVATRRALVHAAAENERSKVASATRLAALPLLVSLVFSHVESMRAVLTNLAIPGVPLSMMLFVGGSFAHGPTRRAFAALDDGAMRGLLGYRAMFGAFLFAMAAVGHVPQTFAFTAGLGDLAVGWLAGLVPARLGARGSRLATAFVHGVGALDLLQVMVLAATVVVPWSKSHDYAMTTLSLPWVAVPLMMAVNLHGLRLALGRSKTRENQASEEPRGARPEPARHVRGALRGA